MNMQIRQIKFSLTLLCITVLCMVISCNHDTKTQNKKVTAKAEKPISNMTIMPINAVAVKLNEQNERLNDSVFQISYGVSWELAMRDTSIQVLHQLEWRGKTAVSHPFKVTIAAPLFVCDDVETKVFNFELGSFSANSNSTPFTFNQCVDCLFRLTISFPNKNNAKHTSQEIIRNLRFIFNDVYNHAHGVQFDIITFTDNQFMPRVSLLDFLVYGTFMHSTNENLLGLQFKTSAVDVSEGVVLYTQEPHDNQPSNIEFMCDTWRWEVLDFDVFNITDHLGNTDTVKIHFVDHDEFTNVPYMYLEWEGKEFQSFDMSPC